MPVNYGILRHGYSFRAGFAHNIQYFRQYFFIVCQSGCHGFDKGSCSILQDILPALKACSRFFRCIRVIPGGNQSEAANPVREAVRHLHGNVPAHGMPGDNSFCNM